MRDERDDMTANDKETGQEADDAYVTSTDIDNILASPTKKQEKGYTRDDLHQKAKDELIDIILNLQMRVPRQTERIGTSEPKFPSKVDVDIVDFQMLPNARTIRIEDKTATSWKLILVNADSPDRPMGIELYADITIGRISRESTPDLDLTLHGGALKGVSREHSMLRPMDDALMLVDLGSTNGTFVNEEQLEPGSATPIRDGDTISFSQLHFKVKIVQSPPGALT